MSGHREIVHWYIIHIIRRIDIQMAPAVSVPNRNSRLTPPPPPSSHWHSSIIWQIDENIRECRNARNRAVWILRLIYKEKGLVLMFPLSCCTLESVQGNRTIDCFKTSKNEVCNMYRIKITHTHERTYTTHEAVYPVSWALVTRYPCIGPHNVVCKFYLLFNTRQF